VIASRCTSTLLRRYLGYAAVQLASARMWQEPIGVEVVVGRFDRQLWKAATQGVPAAPWMSQGPWGRGGGAQAGAVMVTVTPINTGTSASPNGVNLVFMLLHTREWRRGVHAGLQPLTSRRVVDFWGDIGDILAAGCRRFPFLVLEADRWDHGETVKSMEEL
jgi:hypothetical protein